VPLIVSDISTLLSNTVPVPAQSLTFQTLGLGRPNDVTLIPFYQVQHQRYSVYWSLMGPSAVCVWSGGGSPANWSVGANWNLTPTNQCAVQFGLASGGTTTNDLAVGTQMNGIQFSSSAGGFVLNGNSIVLQGDVVNNSSSTQQINLPLQLTNGIAWNFNAAAGDLTLGNTVSGSGLLNKQGSHTLTVLSNLTFSGSVHVAAGQLQIGNGGASGSLGSLAVTVDAGASLAFNRGDTFQVGNAISGAGSVIKRGAGTMELSGVLSNTGPTIIEAGTLQIGSQAVPVLKHRWSFNGNLTDSAGTSNAVVVDVGTNNTSLSVSNITLAGGSQSASDYVSLGSGLLPKDGSPVTIELWATQLGAQNWSRIFDVGSSTLDYLFMSWCQGTDTTKDRVEWKDSVTATTDNSVAPYTLGTEYHIAMVVQPGAGSGGNTRATWYVAPATNSSLGAARGTFDTANTLAAFNDSNFWLGRSEYADNTANAGYDEVRLWSRAFSASELQQLHALGPNSVGAFATNNLTGSLAAQSDLVLQSGATLDLGGTAQQVASVTGVSGSVIQMGGGQLSIGTGANSATFSGSFTGSGSIVVNGVFRLVGNATFAPGVAFTNIGTLDLMTWSGTLPSGFVNHGTVLDRSRVYIDSASVSSNGFRLGIQGYTGHNYQLQYRDSLATGMWQNIGLSCPGAGVPILFTNPPDADNAGRFFRIVLSP
jgi:autotransporter-associated beta strand protein